MDQNNYIESIKRFRDTINKELKGDDSNSSKLYMSITDTMVTLFNLESVKSAYAKLSESLSEEASNDLLMLLILIMTHASYNSIATYDALLKAELTDQLQKYGDQLNLIAATVNGHTGVLEVFKKRIGELEKKNKIDEVTK